MKRRLLFILLIVLFCGMFSGCYDLREVDNLTYVMALGIDKGKTNDLKLTLQYVIPKAVGGGGEGGGEGGGKALQTISIETPSYYAGLNMANAFIGKQVNLSHAKVMVFSEEIAKAGIGKFLHSFARGREFRPTVYMAVSRTSAEDYIKSIKPVQEVDPSKYYDLKFQSYKYAGFSANTEFHRFYNHAVSYAQSPIAALCGVSDNDKSDDFAPSDSTVTAKGRSKPLEGDFKAGDLPKVGDIKGEVFGLAVFKGEKMVGELDGTEATDFLFVTGEFKSSYFTLPDPINKDTYNVLEIKERRAPSTKVEMVNGKPKISVKVNLEGDILGIRSTTGYEDPSLTPVLERSVNTFFESEIQSFLNKTAKGFESDICGFGKDMRFKFLTWNEWTSFDWFDKYKDATFSVDVDFKLRRPGLIIRSEKIKGMD